MNQKFHNLNKINLNLYNKSNKRKTFTERSRDRKLLPKIEINKEKKK